MLSDLPSLNMTKLTHDTACSKHVVKLVVSIVPVTVVVPSAVRSEQVIV